MTLKIHQADAHYDALPVINCQNMMPETLVLRERSDDRFNGQRQDRTNRHKDCCRVKVEPWAINWQVSSGALQADEKKTCFSTVEMQLSTTPPCTLGKPPEGKRDEKVLAIVMVDVFHLGVCRKVEGLLWPAPELSSS